MYGWPPLGSRTSTHRRQVHPTTGTGRTPGPTSALPAVYRYARPATTLDSLLSRPGTELASASEQPFTVSFSWKVAPVGRPTRVGSRQLTKGRSPRGSHEAGYGDEVGQWLTHPGLMGIIDRNQSGTHRPTTVQPWYTPTNRGPPPAVARRGLTRSSDGLTRTDGLGRCRSGLTNGLARTVHNCTVYHGQQTGPTGLEQYPWLVQEWSTLTRLGGCR